MNSQLLFRSFVACSLALVATSCGGGGGGGGSTSVDDPPEPPPGGFESQTSSDMPVNLYVTDGVGAPIAYAIVQIVSPLESGVLPETEEDVEEEIVYLHGSTDSFGRLDGVASIPTELTNVDLVVDKNGYTGTYTWESLRTQWGLFAPSARFATSPDSLDGLTVTLSTL